MTFVSWVNVNPSWSPDGRVVVFNTVAPDEVWSAFADGSGQEHRLVSGFRPRLAGASLPAPYIVFETRGQSSNRTNIHLAPYHGPATAIDPKSVRAAAEGPANREYPGVSPAGDLLAYQSDESGGYEVCIRRFPDGEGQWRVSSDGGGDPRWSRDGRELFFRNAATNTLLVVEIQTGATITISTPQTLFSADKIGAVLAENAPSAQAPGTSSDQDALSVLPGRQSFELNFARWISARTWPTPGG